jgi:hypothetical protein
MNASIADQTPSVNAYQQRALATRSRRAPARKAARAQLATVDLCSRRLADHDQAPVDVDIDYAAELADLEEGMLDDGDWQYGQW